MPRKAGSKNDVGKLRMTIHDEVRIRTHRVHAGRMANRLRFQARHHSSHKFRNRRNVARQKSTLNLQWVGNHLAAGVFRDLDRRSIEAGETVKRSFGHIEQKPAPALIDGIILIPHAIPHQDFSQNLKCGKARNFLQQLRGPRTGRDNQGCCFDCAFVRSDRHGASV